MMDKQQFPMISDQINNLIKSMGPTFEMLRQVQRTIGPQLSIMQSVIQSVNEQHKRLSAILIPPKEDFIIFRPRPALTYSDIPYLRDDISDAVADKLAKKLKIYKQPRIKKLERKQILFKDHSLFLVESPYIQYSLRTSGKRMEMLTLLIGAGEEFTPANAIRKYSGSASNETVRKEIGTLNKKIGEALGLSEKIIECVPGVGYRINSQYKIKVIN